MVVSLALALALGLPQGSDPATRGPSDAFIAAIDRVCPIYMKHSGLTAADTALLEAEMAMRAGLVGYIKQDPTSPPVMLWAAFDSCLVMGGPNETANAQRPTRSELTDAVRAWLLSPDSGWTPAPTDDEPERYISSGGEHSLILRSPPDEGGTMAQIQAVASSFLTGGDTRREAGRQASARPVDQAILEAIDTLCAVAGTPTWNTIDRGEINVRHAGNRRLTVNYEHTSDCMVRVEGDTIDEIDAIVRALQIRLESLGSGWIRINHAWMMPSGGIGGTLANYRHDDGRELALQMSETDLQAILWQPQPRRSD